MGAEAGDKQAAVASTDVNGGPVGAGGSVGAGSSAAAPVTARTDAARIDLTTAAPAPEESWARVRRAIEDIAAGRMVVVVDDEDRENEGDLIMAAELATAADINFMATHARGLICVSLPERRLAELELPLMVAHNTESQSTAFTVSCDLVGERRTGISAFDRADTIAALCDPATVPAQLARPGHIFPLAARPGGVLTRAGHTEAAHDLAQLAGLSPAGVLVEVMSADGTMARRAELDRFATAHGLNLLTVADLISYRAAHASADRSAPAGKGQGPAGGQSIQTGARQTVTGEQSMRAAAPRAQTGEQPIQAEERQTVTVEKRSQAKLPTRTGGGEILVYASPADGRELVAVVTGEIGDGEDVLVRVHSECLTGDVLGSARCDCGEQLRAAEAAIATAGRGVLLYVRGDEGRGIGLAAKIQAYHLQDGGLDTVDANIALGFPADGRDYASSAAVLADLGVRSVGLLTNNPEKVAALERHGAEVRRRVGLTTPVTPDNIRYLRTKRDRMGHALASVAGGCE